MEKKTKQKVIRGFIIGFILGQVVGAGMFWLICMAGAGMVDFDHMIDMEMDYHDLPDQ